MQSTGHRLCAFVYSAGAYASFGFSLIYLVAFLINHEALPTTVDRGPVAASWQAVVIDLLLIAVFGLQHSVMARPWFKRWWTRVVPASIERSTYVLIASALTVALCAAWRPIPRMVWSVPSSLSPIVSGPAVVAGLGVLIAASFQIDHWELLGLRQTWAALRGVEASAAPFAVRGFYRLVRHPIYVGWLLLLWVTPRMTVGHLLLAAGMTVYTLIAIRFEERDLIRDHGAKYIDYRARVPALLPRPLRRLRRKAHGRLSIALALPVIAGLCAGLAGQAHGASAAAGIERLVFDSGGRERSALLVAPSGQGLPERIVLMLHGAGGDAERIRKFTAYGLERLAADGRWIVAYPQGIGGTWNDCRRSPPYLAKQLGVDDVRFLIAVIERLRARYAVVPEDVLVGGFSNGGQMAIRVAIERPDAIGAIAVVAAQLPVAGEATCRLRIPAVRSLWINGTEDPFVPPEGGASIGPSGVRLGEVGPLEATIRQFATAFPGASSARAHRLAEADGDASTYVMRSDWVLEDRIVLRQLVLHGSGHVVPQREVALPAIAGPAAGDIDLAEAIAEFFDLVR